MARWKLSVRDNLGHAIITLHDLKKPLGMATMPWYDYSRMWKEVTAFAHQLCIDTIERTLQDRLWQDALSRYNSDSEQAKAKLLEFGWSTEKIRTYAEHLGMLLVQKFIEHIPEHEG